MKNHTDVLIFHTTICAGASQISLDGRRKLEICVAPSHKRFGMEMKMNFWKMMYVRWGREDISAWKSMKKAVYIIFPLLVYFLIHDAAQILSWAALNQFLLASREETVNFLNANGYTVQGIINGLAILCGVAAIWQAVKNEISWAECKDVDKDKDQENFGKSSKEWKLHDAKGDSLYGAWSIFLLLSIGTKCVVSSAGDYRKIKILYRNSECAVWSCFYSGTVFIRRVVPFGRGSSVPGAYL